LTKSSKKPDGKITMKHIAAEAGVSLGTVSHVMSGNVHVRSALRQRVMTAVRNLGYQPSLLARDLRRNKSSIIGMVIPDITNPFFPAVVRGVEDIAYQNSFRLILCNTDDDSGKEKSYLRELYSYHIAGLVLIPTVNSHVVDLAEVRASNVPVICLDRRPTDWEGDSVTVDNVQGSFAATAHLTKLGHRTIALITGSQLLDTAAARLEGFRSAIRKAKLEVAPEYIQEGRYDRLSGYEKTRVLLQQRPRPTAIVCSNDLVAIGVLSGLKEAGLRCPEDVSVIGFDDIETCELTDPPLTTVFQPGYQMGAKGAALLIKRIRGDAEPPLKIVLPTELKVRRSAAAPHHPARG
jgi:DNA-binding LacI/PurR family transcriptional regulator